MPALSEMPYLFAVPDATDEEVQEACYELFATSQGQLVLNRLYWKVMMRSPGDLREVGEQDLFRYLVDTIQRGWAVKQRRTYGGSGDSTDTLPSPWD